ncbi:MAG: aminotransferase class V-fold PLP-dependent enzyme [Actinomycetota bacterium]
MHSEGLDLDRLRADTPGAEHVVHLNNCGSSLPPTPVVDAMVGYLRAEALEGGYEIAADRADQLADFHTATAEYLGAEAGQIALASGAAEAWWRAFTAVPLSPGDRILVTTSEYQANAFGWMTAAERGAEVEVIPVDADGLVDLDAFDAMIDERVKLVSFTMISLGNGAVQPAAAAAARLRQTGSSAVFLLDACQAAGQMPLDVEALGCDFLVYTGRKFMRGPRGTGVLYARRSVLDRLGPAWFVDGRSAIWQADNSYELLGGAQRFEFGEFGYGAKIGLAVATRYMLDVGIDAIAERVGRLSERLRDQLGSIDAVTVHDEGASPTDRCGIVTFTVEGVASADLAVVLREHGINTSVPHRTAAQLDLGRRDLTDVVRAGVHYFNTESELDRLCEVVQAASPQWGS